jgi:hypothetical protein
MKESLSPKALGVCRSFDTHAQDKIAAPANAAGTNCNAKAMDKTVIRSSPPPSPAS